MALRMSAEAFERIAWEELDALPAEMTSGLENVAFVIEEAAEGEALLGRYDGIDLTRRDRYGFGELPDRIIVYRSSHLASAVTEQDLRDELHATLVHEIGHFYGLDDRRLHELGWA